MDPHTIYLSFVTTIDLGMGGLMVFRTVDYETYRPF